jgi:hypothetical protein
MIYTTYLKKLKDIKLNDNDIIVFCGKYLPGDKEAFVLKEKFSDEIELHFDVGLERNIWLYKALAPSFDAYAIYRNTKQNTVLLNNMSEIVNFSSKVQDMLKNLVKKFNIKGKNCYLVGLYKDSTKCHRSVLSGYINEKLKAIVTEI